MKKDRKKHLRRLTARKDRRFAERRERRDDYRAEDAVAGSITITMAGLGFVKPDADDGEKLQDIFIPPQFVNGAMDGDKVKVVLLPERPEFGKDDRGPAGRVVEITERARDTIVGELISGHQVRPLSRKINSDIEISGRLHGAKRGDWVKLKLIHTDDALPTGQVMHNIGKSGSIKTDLDAVCAEYNLEPPYSEEDCLEAAELPLREIEREDHRKLFSMTIDPTDAKDFDDAVSIAPGKRDDLVEIGVHIADLAAIVAPRSKWDKQAAKRSFTAYLPGRTLPMLPKTLTARISLHEGEDCPAHTIFFQVERETGKIVEHRRCHTWLRIGKRLDYETVQNFLDTGTIPADWTKSMATQIEQLCQVTRAMRKLRLKTEEFIDLAIPSVHILCDENADKISGLASKIQRESEMLVEECMLAANSAVGEDLQKIGVAGLYRVHPEPDPEKLAEFCETVEASFGINPGDLSNRHNCRQFIEGLPDDPRRPILLSLLLRSLPRASYLEKPEPHFGLGKLRYSHFTSPIRRYPDLTIHQQLWNYDHKQRTRTTEILAAVAADCSAKEENNDNAFFTACDRMKLRYLQEQLDAGQENFYEGIIAKVNTNGLLADIPALGIYGFIPRENLAGHGYNRTDGALRDSHGNREYRCGDYIYLKLSQIDPVRGAAEFKPVSR